MNRNKRKGFALWIVLSVLISFFSLFFTACEETEEDKSSFAESAARQVVSNMLKSPSSAIWNEVDCLEYDANGKYLVYLDVEASNSFGGMIRTRYFVCVSNLDLEAKTFSYNRSFAALECDGKDDSHTLTLLKKFNKYDDTTATASTGGGASNGEMDDSDEVIDVICIVFLPALVGYCVLYFCFYKQGKLQSWQKIFLPLIKLFETSEPQKLEGMEQSEQNTKENEENDFFKD